MVLEYVFTSQVALLNLNLHRLAFMLVKTASSRRQVESLMHHLDFVYCFVILRHFSSAF